MADRLLRHLSDLPPRPSPIATSTRSDGGDPHDEVRPQASSDTYDDWLEECALEQEDEEARDDYAQWRAQRVVELADDGNNDDFSEVESGPWQPRFVPASSALDAGSIGADGTERRSFVMHENLLRDVIQRQAGSLSKAVLEGVMNLVEAGATRGTIAIHEKRLVIADDGRGFSSREEVLEAFEVFGKSDERRLLAGRWAEFQMGRGQLMAFGRTSYRTRTFEMTTDIASSTGVGVGYDLRQDLEDVLGCTVTVDLYRSLGAWEIQELVEAVGVAVRYVDVPIEVNGTVVSVDPAGEKWSFQDDNAYYRIRSIADRLEVYNLGVFVSDLHHWGTGGVIVSKKRLALNFARNDVLSTCPVWTSVLAEFKARTRHALLEKKAPTVRDVQLILGELGSGRFELGQVAVVPLLRDANGRRLSPSDFVARCEGNYRADSFRNIEAFSLDYAKSAKADYAMESRPWLLLDAEFTAEAFAGSPTPSCFESLGELAPLLIDVLHWHMGRRGAARRSRSRLADMEQAEAALRARFVPRDVLYEGLEFTRLLVPDEKLDRDESAVMTALRRENAYIAQACDEAPRRLLVGSSDGLEAWTDGQYVAFDRAFLRRCLKVPHGLLRLLHVLVHEYTHVDDDMVHGLEFYRRFHDATMRLGPAHTRILSAVTNIAGSRLNSFRKTAAIAVEGARRFARDESNQNSGAVLPCPGCAVIGPRKNGEGEGVSYDVLAGTISSQEAFDRAFGARFERPKVWTHSGLLECPICGWALHDSAAFAQATKERVFRACELAVTSAAAGVLRPSEARAIAKRKPNKPAVPAASYGSDAGGS